MAAYGVVIENRDIRTLGAPRHCPDCSRNQQAFKLILEPTQLCAFSHAVLCFDLGKKLKPRVRTSRRVGDFHPVKSAPRVNVQSSSLIATTIIDTVF